MKYAKITIKQAIDLLMNDKTATTPVWFVVGNNHHGLNTSSWDINGEWLNAVVVDAGKIGYPNIPATVCSLAAATMFGGIYKAQEE